MMPKLPPAIPALIVAVSAGLVLGAGSVWFGFGADPRMEFVSLSKKAISSVVNISTLSIQPDQLDDREEAFRKYFDDFLGPKNSGPDEEDEPRVYLGSGFLVADGLILTSNHVVAGAERISVRFTEEPDEKPTQGLVVGSDPELDLALISVPAREGHPPLTLGDSDRLEVGEKVIAIGNPFGQGHSVTHGIISAKNRDGEHGSLARYLQTDAPINPGNSGGPLLSLDGEVVGINSAIEARGQGIGFAIPINLVKKILPQLKLKGSVARGDLGVTVNALTAEIAEHLKAPKGLRAPFVAEVAEGHSSKGLRAYDIILSVNDKKTQTEQDLLRVVSDLSAGKTVPVQVIRAGKKLALKILVTERPSVDHSAFFEPPLNDELSKSFQKLGLVLEDLTPSIAREFQFPNDVEEGVVVTDLDPTGVAASSGLHRGDVIMEVDRVEVDSAAQFYSKTKNSKSYLIKAKRFDAEAITETYRVLVLDLSNR